MAPKSRKGKEIADVLTFDEGEGRRVTRRVLRRRVEYTAARCAQHQARRVVIEEQEERQDEELEVEQGIHGDEDEELEVEHEERQDVEGGVTPSGHTRPITSSEASCSTGHVRGVTIGVTLRKSSDGRPTPVIINANGKDVHNPSFTTRLAMNVKAYVPLCSFDWRSVSAEHKDRLITAQQIDYDWGEDPKAVSHILRHAAKLHKNWRVVTKKKYFMGKTPEEALANPPRGVPPHDWQRAVEHWCKPETRARASTNAAIRSRGPPVTHSLGRSSIGRIKESYVAKNNGSIPSRMHIYELTHTRSGEDDSQETMHSLVNPTNLDVAPLDLEVAFTQVMPQEYGVEVRCAGRGETPTTWRKKTSEFETRLANIEHMIYSLKEENTEMRRHISEMLALIRSQVSCSQSARQDHPGHDHDDPPPSLPPAAC